MNQNRRRRRHPLMAVLDEERVRRGLTIAQFADLACVSPRTAESWMYEERTPPISHLEKVAAKMGYRLELIPVATTDSVAGQ